MAAESGICIIETPVKLVNWNENMLALTELLKLVAAVVIIALMMALLPAQNALARSGDDEAWRAAVERGDAGSFENFLSQYPLSRYAGVAYRCLIESQHTLEKSVCAVKKQEIGPPGPTQSLRGKFAVDLP